MHKEESDYPKPRIRGENVSNPKYATFPTLLRKKELAYSSIISMLKTSMLSDLDHQWLYHHHQNHGLELDGD